MLQINTGKYFRAGVDLHERVQRHVLHTNTWVIRADPVEMSEMELAYSTSHQPRSTVTVTVTERLEKTRPDGTEEIMIAVGGREIVEDLGYVLSFALDATFNLDGDLVRRLVPDEAGPPSAARRRILRRTFDPALLVSEEDLEAAGDFLTRLLALNRPSYEKAIRAIRGVVDAANRVYDDPTLAYTLYVAALESLAPAADADPVPWNRFDPRKRKLFDEAVAGLDKADAERVRTAALEAERAGLAARFQSFVMGHLTDPFFRSEAAGVLLPLRASELPIALTEAYKVRSGNVHVLAQLPREAWLFTDGFDTVRPVGGRVMLTLAGLNRLSRHVVMRYIERADTVDIQPFDYRSALPNVVQMQIASEYWVWNADGLNHDTAERYFIGVLELWLNILGGHREGWVDLRDVLAKIEAITPGLDDRKRVPLLATYAMWHSNTDASLHRPKYTRFLSKYGRPLEQPSMTTFVLSLAGARRTLSLEDLERVATQRRAELAERKHTFPAVLDASLFAILADELEDVGRHDEALGMINEAIRELPGNEELIRFESVLKNGEARNLNTRAVLVGNAKSTNDSSSDASEEPGTSADTKNGDDARHASRASKFWTRWSIRRKGHSRR